VRFADKIAAWLVSILGIAHLAVGHAVFIDPTERRIWFASAGFLLIVTGLANLGAQDAKSRIQSLAAAVGSVSIMVLGALLARADPDLLMQPQTLTLLALGALLTICRTRDLIAHNRR
jgi:peptidoglycan/LPS O-acetylase OafA/YrhL